MRKITVRRLGTVPYEAVWHDMRNFAASRTPQDDDEIWLVSHPPVYTLGTAADPRHILRPTGIRVVRSDRGGQVTYHGPGQAIAYLLLDLQRSGQGIRSLVHGIEEAVIALLAAEGIAGARHAGQPGVYVGGSKVAALGLRVKRRCTYHGVSLNVDCDLAPYDAINPCGWRGLKVTSLCELGCTLSAQAAAEMLAAQLADQLCAAAC